MNTNEVIANIALELSGKPLGSYSDLNPNDHVNRSQPTNDAYPTAFRVSLYFYLKELIKKIESLIQSLSKKAEDFQSVLKMGRTQLQDAVPMFFRR